MTVFEYSILYELLRQGLTPAEAVDYYYVEIQGLSQTKWANVREVNQQAVSQNIGKAKAKFNKLQNYE